MDEAQIVSPDKPESGDPHYVSGVQSGFDPAAQLWKDSYGNTVNRAQALARLQADLEALGGALVFDRDKLSRAAEELEHFIAGDFDPFTPQDAGRPPEPYPIPASVLSAYRLSNYYWRTEGDVASAIESPITLSMRDLDVKCPDTAVKREIEALADVDGLDLVEKGMAMWLSMAVFGIAHPCEVWQGIDLRDVVLLPPMYTAVGSYRDQYELLPFDRGERYWQEEALKTQLPVALYDGLYKQPEENAPGGRLLIGAEDMRSIRGLDQAWEPYPKTWLTGAFRALSTRIVYEEMRRAVYEGFRHQLWLFLLGDADHKPTPQMMAKLMADIDGMSGKRTGSLAWWGALKVQVVTPEEPEVMKSAEWWMLSLDIFRRLGVNMRVATGSTTPEDKGQDFEVDVDLMLEKYDYWRSGILRWMRGFLLRYGKRTKKPETWMKAVRDTDIVFSVTAMALKKIIADRLKPMYTMGVMSVRTTLERADENFEVELKNKKEEMKTRDLWIPSPTYTQTTVGPQGKTSASTEPQGRPPGVNGKGQPVQAGYEDDVQARRRKYITLLVSAFEAMESDPDRFIARLKELNQSELVEFARMGYRLSRGMLEDVPEPYKSYTYNFVNSFADAFGADMKAGGGRMDYRRRTMLYGDEGYRSAFLNGVQAAMAERGATHWRRMLHPELSVSGPCYLCRTDSEVLHKIGEPFQSLHPHEVCSMSPLRVRFTGPGGLAEEVEMGVPGVTRNAFDDVLDESGIDHDSTVVKLRAEMAEMSRKLEMLASQSAGGVKIMMPGSEPQIKFEPQIRVEPTPINLTVPPAQVESHTTIVRPPD